MTKRFLLTLLALPAFLLEAQTAVVPTPGMSPYTLDSVNYKVTDAVEAGYRFSAVGGDQALYRSNVNYGNGLRLLSNNFTANSKQGHGGLFDTMLISTQGLGSDPYGLATARIEKNLVYRYDGIWRRSEYYNPFQNNGESGNLRTTRRDMQDHDLTVSASKRISFRLGYSRNRETGPAVSTYQLYLAGLYPLPAASEPGATHGNSILPILQDVRRDWNAYRFGSDIDFAGFRLSITRQLYYYKDDTSVASLAPGQPYPEPNTSVATTYVRSEPMHVRSPAWFGNLATNRKRWAMNGRVSYMKSDSTFVYEETGTGTIATTAAPKATVASVSTSNLGVARRPYLSGDLSFSYFPTEKLSIVSDTSAQNNRIDSTGTILQTSTASAAKNIFWGWYMDVARYSESLDLNYRPTNWLGLNGSYLYTDRSVDQRVYRTGTTNSNAPGALVNHVNAGTIGFRLKPLKTLSISLDAGRGRDNGPYTPESLANYHTIRGRIDYRLRKLRLAATYRQLYNLNAPVLYSYDNSHSRGITASSSFEIRGRWWFDASYSKSHQDTFSALYAELPSAAGPITNVRGYDSVYISNVHSVSIMTRTQFGRATISAGYNLTRDAGDGRNLQNLGLTDPAAAYLALGQTFPMRYQAPLARLSIKITPKFQWNAGWEFYRYNQQFAYYGYQPGYRAQTGYTSLSWML